ncbi:hypothetical protein [Parafrigoribacterium humi]|uniref:hypothetical protein n=1 Tax=Parafrigoribacterium humi TaxID=3144664 RepID=UPI0032EE9396
MAGDLVISGGGTTEVATESLLVRRQQLKRLRDELGDCIAGLHSIDGRVTRAGLRAADAPPSALRAETAMTDAAHALRSARNRADQIVDGLDHVITSYSNADGAAGEWARRASAMLAHQLGSVLPLAMLVGIPLLVPGLLTAGAFGIVWAFTPASTRKKALAAWAQEHKPLLSDPRFVGMLRLAVSSSDDFGEGVIGVPEPVGELLGDDGLGILGVSSSAAAVVGALGTTGVLRETPVTVYESRAPKPGPRASTANSITANRSAAGSPPPTGLAQRVDRIPTGVNQIRIDKYVQPSAPDRYEVYLAGTIDTSLVATTEPWDMTSNLNGVAGGSPGSLEATKLAMTDAGIDETTPVTFTGYSQGGLVAAELAASGDYDTRGLVTFGGPAGAVSVPHDIPYVALEHADDLVPATGGVWKSSDPLLVTRTVYADQPYAGDLAVPAHQLVNYRETATMADASDEQRLVAMRDVLSDFAGQPATVETRLYRAVRTGP